MKQDTLPSTNAVPTSVFEISCTKLLMLLMAIECSARWKIAVNLFLWLGWPQPKTSILLQQGTPSFIGFWRFCAEIYLSKLPPNICIIWLVFHWLLCGSCFIKLRFCVTLRVQIGGWLFSSFLQGNGCLVGFLWSFNKIKGKCSLGFSKVCDWLGVVWSGQVIQTAASEL